MIAAAVAGEASFPKCIGGVDLENVPAGTWCRHAAFPLLLWAWRQGLWGGGGGGGGGDGGAERSRRRGEGRLRAGVEGHGRTQVRGWKSVVLCQSGSLGGHVGTTERERGRVERWEVEDGGGHGGTTKRESRRIEIRKVDRTAQRESGRVEVRKVDRTTEKGGGGVEIRKVDGRVGHIDTTETRGGPAERSRSRCERGPSRWGRLAILRVPADGIRAGEGRSVDFGI